ncbi:hypothetical protein P153DRAFT_298823 [Dothidotthia symphoricarpi CBS 119687]|uniref:Uncharacterized protein n=1 Tax=Dothidotthia symphoricarpi CBS 119687 TaxID=1392245 RepID=A0A6A6A2F3_9PLEO|nr:uncharacterized protein P153DRAFT_298823 [Dothidotthia symphoricarpi CBS 119687]KAF2125716.1 hypothetical protein P153DRAFT_298823 [Dothidotthia symphoricarpi CBS 119687]
MVSTRQHPQGNFPVSAPSPVKKSSRTSTASPAPSSPTIGLSSSSESLARRAVSSTATAISDTVTVASKAVDVAAPPSSSEIDESAWCHTASNITIVWLTVSIPLVIWDSLYIFLRPHTMAGGKLQWPIWKPYEIYAKIDHVYGWPGWESGDGFGGAQAALNAIECILYGLYVMIIYNHSLPAAAGTGFQAGKGIGTWLAGGRKVRGKTGNRALIIGFAAAVMTLSKTVLYYFNEYFSGFHSIGHNDWLTIFFFYVIMNGLWFWLSAYMTVVFGSDILRALDIASERTSRKEN